MKQRGKKKQRIKRNEDNLRDLWDNVKYSNHRSLRRRRQKKVHEKILEEIIVEKFPKMGKEITTQVH